MGIREGEIVDKTMGGQMGPELANHLSSAMDHMQRGQLESGAQGCLPPGGCCGQLCNPQAIWGYSMPTPGTHHLLKGTLHGHAGGQPSLPDACGALPPHYLLVQVQAAPQIHASH